MASFRVAAASAAIPYAWEAAGRELEAPIRVAALALDAGERICILSADVLNVPEDVNQEVWQQLDAQAGIAPGHTLICATHTHHAPCTIDILGMRRDRGFCASLQQTMVEVALEALSGLEGARAGCRLLFAESGEATTGMNSRYLLKDGTIAWYAYHWEDVIRPTGPYDPDLPVFLAVGPDGECLATLFSHSVHNIGMMTPGSFSPATYGLVAQELERRRGGVSLFLPGAFGSTHYTGEFGAEPLPFALTTAERVHRLAAAVEKGLDDADPMAPEQIRVLRRPLAYRVRSFDEAEEAAAVEYWTARYTPENPENYRRMFGEMRAQMAPVRGEERQSWLQVIRLGDVALVGVPGELFTSLGMEIRRRSPFRYTYVVGLANGTIGYIGDREGYRLGGYQLWAGWHSMSAPGTGEAVVEQALGMLGEIRDAGCGMRVGLRGRGARALSRA